MLNIEDIDLDDAEVVPTTEGMLAGLTDSSESEPEENTALEVCKFKERRFPLMQLELLEEEVQSDLQLAAQQDFARDRTHELERGHATHHTR